MKKGTKKLICMLFAVCMAVTSLLIPDTQAQAASKVPKKVHIQTKQTYTDDIQVVFGEGDYKLANVKSNSKNLHVRTTYVNATGSEDASNKETPWGYATIRLYARKNGTYTVTFDVVGRDRKVKSHHSVKVRADALSAVKNITFDGQYLYGVAAKAKGKFKVSLNKGYKLVSIRMTTYDKSGKAVTKKIKNGSSVTLGKYRSKTVYEDSATRENWRADLLAKTEFEISYKDSFTKETKTTTSYLYRLPSN